MYTLWYLCVEGHVDCIHYIPMFASDTQYAESCYNSQLGYNNAGLNPLFLRLHEFKVSLNESQS